MCGLQQAAHLSLEQFVGGLTAAERDFMAIVNSTSLNYS